MYKNAVLFYFDNIVLVNDENSFFLQSHEMVKEC